MGASAVLIADCAHVWNASMYACARPLASADVHVYDCAAHRPKSAQTLCLI